MQKEFFIRTADEHDFVRMIDIAHLAWPEFAERNSIYHLFTKHFKDTCFVAEIENVIIGFILGFFSQVSMSEAYIHLVCVDPKYQRRNVATNLYNSFLEKAQKAGKTKVSLIINPDNATSIAFHIKMGFKANLYGQTKNIEGVEAVKDYNGEGIHMIPFYMEI